MTTENQTQQKLLQAEPELKWLNQEKRLPCPKWVKWFRDKNGCGLRQAVDAGAAMLAAAPQPPAQDEPHPVGDTHFEVSPNSVVRAAFAQGYETGRAHGKVERPPALGGESVQRFWAEEAHNIRCVRESDFDEHVARLQAEVERMKEESFESLYNDVIDERDKLLAEVERLTALLDTPHTDEWFEGVKLEAGHQIKRWGTDHDAGKAPADWFWLIGYLAQKAMTSQMIGNEEKAKHHTISTGAALLNWFRAIVGDSNVMRPGIDAALNKTEGQQS